MRYSKALLAATILAASLLNPNTSFAREKATRVHFSRGASSATIRGFHPHQSAGKFYIVNARAGQTLSARIHSRTIEWVPLLFITSPSGQNLIEDKRTSYTKKLTESGDYKVRVGVNLMATNANAGKYELNLRMK